MLEARESTGMKQASRQDGLSSNLSGPASLSGADSDSEGAEEGC